MNYDHLIGLDFETYGAVNLPDHGLERYAADSTFRPLIAEACNLRYDGAYNHQGFDFVQDYYESARKGLIDAVEDRTIVAHNAGFEQRVLQAMDIDTRGMSFIDSAVVARAAGAGGKLEAAAPQLLGVNKLEDGWRLIKLFSIPSAAWLERGNRHFDVDLPTLFPADWSMFKHYCQLDARLSLRLAIEIGYEGGIFTPKEMTFQHVTMEMNQQGWHVDTERVEEMQRRYLENQEVALADFRERYDAHDLNLASLKQLKEWCAKRGIKATSFDEKHVEKLASRIDKKLDSMVGSMNDPKYRDYREVLALLRAKQILGGSSLKKLQVILDTVGDDGRLRDQYFHVGAGQSWRTTGRSVQMQNLKRLAEPAAMETLDDPDVDWDNEMLAENIRQVFTSVDPDGMLVVGDFASVESRGLAWLANEHWKLDAYRQGKDMYKVLASTPELYGVPYEQVTKAQRQTGKFGELSCGYGAGGPAVQSFAANMGAEMTEAEAAKLVSGWRSANPRIVAFWQTLDDALHLALKTGDATVPVGYNFLLKLTWGDTPISLRTQHPGAKSLRLEVFDEDHKSYMVRIFHGCYERGRNICYYKPSQLKSGDLWSNHFTDPKTKQVKFYSLYGGKLAGIVTQSFCRELFFQSLVQVHHWASRVEGVDLIGQFHDEIVLDWHSPVVSLEATEDALQRYMSDTGRVRGFPMVAEIKHDYRYIK